MPYKIDLSFFDQIENPALISHIQRVGTNFYENKSYKKDWGKADKDGKYHLLVYHCLDVIAVADCWWQQDLALQQTLQRAIKIEPDKLSA